jgi:N-methylhydantoinase A
MPASRIGRRRGLIEIVFFHFDVVEGMHVVGPAIIETPRTTYLVEPGWKLHMGRLGSAVMEKES